MTTATACKSDRTDVAIAWEFYEEGAEPKLDKCGDPQLTELAFECGCEFRARAGGAQREFRVDQSVCLPEIAVSGGDIDAAAETFCAETVCRGAQFLIADVLGGPECPDVAFLGALTNAVRRDDSCGVDCGQILCDVEISGRDLRGNHLTCNTVRAPADEDCSCAPDEFGKPLFDCAAVEVGPVYAPESGIERQVRTSTAGVSAASDAVDTRSGVLGQLVTPRSRAQVLRDSQVVLRAGDRKAIEGLSGVVSIMGGPCPGTRCDIGLRVALDVNDFQFANRDVTDGTLVFHTQEPVELSSSGIAMVQPGMATGNIFARFDGERVGIATTNETPLMVRLDWDASTLVISGAFSRPEDDEAEEFSATLHVVATVENQPPFVSVEAERTVECNATESATFEAVANVSDPDDDLTATTWTQGNELQGGERLADGNPAEITLPLGDHQLSVTTVDDNLQFAFGSQHVSVVDTTPPRIEEFVSTAPPCLWPPNHEFAVLRVGREFRAMLSDVCDPAPVLEIAGATSSQPANSVGDGDTDTDIVVFPDHICIRSERQGTEREGRQYTVQLFARDAAGNENDPIVELVVPHDQRPADRCTPIEIVETVSADDPTCDPQLAELAWMALEHPSSRGAPPRDATITAAACTVGRGGGRPTSLAIVLILGLTIRRRRRFVQ